MNPTSASTLAGRRRICSSCKRDIFWRVHVVTGKPAPLDAQPVDDGNIVLDDGETYRVLTKAERATVVDIPRYTSHFATCPTARQHRRP